MTILYTEIVQEGHQEPQFNRSSIKYVEEEPRHEKEQSQLAYHAELQDDFAIKEYSLTSSYIIIDNRGNLIDNDSKNYNVIGSLPEEPFADVFRRYAFNRDAYESRYSIASAG